jgi:hypothetical protein
MYTYLRERQLYNMILATIWSQSGPFSDDLRDCIEPYTRLMNRAFQTSPDLFNASRELLSTDGVCIGTVLGTLRDKKIAYPPILDTWQLLNDLLVTDTTPQPPPQPQILTRRASVFQSTLLPMTTSVVYPYIKHHVDADRLRVRTQLTKELYMTYQTLESDTIYNIGSNIGLDPTIISILVESRETICMSEGGICSFDVVMILIGVILLLVVGGYCFHLFQ